MAPDAMRSALNVYSKAGGAILTHTTPDASKKLAYLDGLRGIASLVVVLTHYKLMLYPRFLDPRFQEQERYHIFPTKPLSRNYR